MSWYEKLRQDVFGANSLRKDTKIVGTFRLKIGEGAELIVQPYILMVYYIQCLKLDVLIFLFQVKLIQSSNCNMVALEFFR